MQAEDDTNQTPDSSQSKDHADGSTDDAVVEIGVDDLSPNQREAIARAGWASLMPVQARALPILAEGRDVMVQSRTGSGKTGAFFLPMIDLLDPNEKTAQALVLVPTRELAIQVGKEAELLCALVDRES